MNTSTNCTRNTKGSTCMKLLTLEVPDKFYNTTY